MPPDVVSPRPAGRVLVVGDLMLDVLIAGPESGPEVSGLHVRAGGAAANVALALASAGVEVVVLGRTGPDPNGTWIRSVLAAASVKLPLEPEPGLVTGYVVAHRRGALDRVVYVERGANRALHRGGAEEGLLREASWLHVSGYGLVEAGPAAVVLALARRARALGVPVSLDPGVPPAFSGRAPQDVLALVRLGLDEGPDALLPSTVMAGYLAGPGTEDARQASLDLAGPFRAVIVKDGARGAWIAGRQLRPGGAPVAPEADVTGAGDVFDAAFIAAMLAAAREGVEPRSALAVAAGKAVQAAGGYVEATVSGRQGAGPGWRRVRRQDPPVLVSACLCGVASAYDGRSRSRGAFGPGEPSPGAFGPGEASPGAFGPGEPSPGASAPDEALHLPFCPEQLGGLTTPRPPAEIHGDGTGEGVIRGLALVVDPSGRDLTESFLRGARRAAELARATGAARALLKEGSPSCGPGMVGDGTFSSAKIPGQGVTAATLRRLGVAVEAVDL